MGSTPNTGQWADESHLPAWLIADVVDDPDTALDEATSEHLKSCPACDVLLRQAQAGADESGWIPSLETHAGSTRASDLARFSLVLVSNMAARLTPLFAPGQVWQLAGWQSCELAVITKVGEGGAFVAPLTNDPSELTDPYTVQVSLNRSSMILAAWFSLETFVHAEVFSGSIDDIDTSLIAAGRAAWRSGSPLSSGYVVGPSTLHRSELITYWEQLQQRITSLAHVQIVPESTDEDDADPAHIVLRALGVKTAKVREVLDVNATVAGSILSGDRTLGYEEARRLSEALEAEIPATTITPDPGLIAAVAAPRRRAMFAKLALRKGTDEWTERRLAVDCGLNLAARSTDSTSKWEELLDQYLLNELDAARPPGKSNR
jgi:hypothetical protein